MVRTHLRGEDDDVLREALLHKVAGKRTRGQLKRTWRRQIEEEIGKIGLKKEKGQARW